MELHVYILKICSLIHCIDDANKMNLELVVVQMIQSYLFSLQI